MTVSKKIKLCDSIYNKPIDIWLKNRTWVVSASGLGVPGGFNLFSLNIIYDDDEPTIEVLRTFYIVPHSELKEEVHIDLDSLILLNTIDIDYDSYSVFEVIKDE